jgi:hypothetical protein
MTHEEPDLAQLQEELYITALAGQRLYYPHATITYDDAVQQDSALVFKISSVIPYHMLRNNALYKDSKRTMDWLVTEIETRTRDSMDCRLSRRIDNQWPATVFEEWLESTFDQHWMTSKWYNDTVGITRHSFSSGDPYDDYALMTSVHVPINTSRAEFDKEYGGAFTMTKLMHY